MALLPVNAIAPRNAEPALPGTWKLVAGRAITLEPREDGLLRVAHGQLWATTDGPHGGRPDDSGDHMLAAGERLAVHAGQRVVMEAWNHGAPAYFSWDPLPARELARQPASAALVQPLSDLRLALVFGGGALVRLLAGLGQVGWHFVAGRPRAVAGNACGQGAA